MQLILISDNERDQVFAKDISRLGNFDFKLEPFFSDQSELFKAQTPFLLFFNVKEKDYCARFIETIKAQSKQSSLRFCQSIHFIAESPQEFCKDPVYLDGSVAQNFISRIGMESQSSAKIYWKTIRASLAKSGYGLKRLIENPEKIHNFKLLNSNEKHVVTSQILKISKVWGFRSQFAYHIATTADEAIMNAFYDAPLNSENQQLYQKTHRSKNVMVTPDFAIEVEVAFDEDYFYGSVTDKVGSLDRQKVLEHFARSYSSNRGEARALDSPSAGIGLAYAYRIGASFYINVEPKVRTEVCFFFKALETTGEFRKQFRFISTFFT